MEITNDEYKMINRILEITHLEDAFICQDDPDGNSAFFDFDSEDFTLSIKSSSAESILMAPSMCPSVYSTFVRTSSTSTLVSSITLAKPSTSTFS